MLEINQTGYFPYTPATNLLYGLSEALDMLKEEGLEKVFARHRRWSEGVRGAVGAWGLPIQCADEELHSPILTGVIVPASVDADALRKTILEKFDLSLGAGLGKVKGRMFRIGHLGNSNDLTLLATLAGCEMGLKLAGVNLAGSGVNSAMDYFADHPQKAARPFYGDTALRMRLRMGLSTMIARIATTTLAMAPIHITLCQSPLAAT